MSERSSDFARLFVFAILLAAALFIYDRYTLSRNTALVVEKQHEIHEIAQATSAELKVLTEKTEQQRIQSEDANRKHELELKRLELEIKRAEADTAVALVKQKEIDAQQVEKKREADLAEQTAELKLREAETQKERDKIEEKRKAAQAVSQAKNERASATRRFNDLAARRQAAQGLLIIWKNKLEAARHAKEKAQGDLAAAQINSAARVQQQVANNANNNNSVGDSTANTHSGSITFSNNDVQNAQGQLAAAAKAEAEAAASIPKAQQEFDALDLDYASAKTEKENADLHVATMAPPVDRNKVFATYTLNDGRKLPALCVIESGDDIWIKTADGVELIKRSEIEEVSKE